MVDFAKLREDAARRAREPVVERKSDLEVINELLQEDVGEWSNNFLLSIKTWLMRREGNYLSPKQSAKLQEISMEFDIVWTKKNAPVPTAQTKTAKEIRENIPFDDIDDDIPF